MVFTQGPFGHTFHVWQRGQALCTISLSPDIARFVQGGVVKTFR